MSKPHAIDICQSMTPPEYVTYVLSSFAETYDRGPYPGALNLLCFWHSINVHPDSAVTMLPGYGY